MKVFAATSPDTFAFDEIAVPKPSDYEVLVRHEGCLICNSTDWMIVQQPLCNSRLSGGSGTRILRKGGGGRSQGPEFSPGRPGYLQQRHPHRL